ncbi:MAG: biotin/lipoyl-containing protein, partial [Burkholderiaceae bacterium]
MAIIEVKVPQLSESVAEATLLQWHKKVGDKVARDENLIDIETDKVVLELPSPDAGVITQVVKADGSTVVAGEVIAILDTEASAGVAQAAVTDLPTPAQAAPVTQQPTAQAPKAAGVAMPAAAKMMADNSMAAGPVAGTGRDGRVTKGDVINALEQKPATQPAA